MNVKQVIVVRKDLNMRKGKIAAQVAHASTQAILQHTVQTDEGFKLDYSSLGRHNESYKEWMNGMYAKVVVSVDSEEEFLKIKNDALNADLPVAVITDSGKTEFNNVPTLTTLAIGPAVSEEIDAITSHLKLL